MFKHLLAACIATGASLTPALAGQCGLREVVVEKLSTKYAERLTVGGLQKTRASPAIIEVWASVETGTFTVLLTKPDGITCIVAAGTDYFESDGKAEPLGTAM